MTNLSVHQGKGSRKGHSISLFFKR